ncbi:pentapeptide repeat-containing protein [Amycolatopsis sp. NPDC059021]|uniref:pentapeptide repeat-containing protein n=1 Tax=Amycolatopsis sp. NPDC059021 TaxID=3346704 RepID=UPI00366CA6A2
MTSHRVLSTRTILLWGAGLFVLATTAAITLLSTLGGGRPEDSARLDALRTAANVVVGTGGAAALLLAARRQRSAELDLVQKDHDATQRRVTEMYSKAAEQLGSDKAPVRLAGLYALERLAQEHEEQRQTIVNVLCAYLRMPFQHDPEDEENRQELQVRRTAERVLTLHLRPGKDGENPAYWPDVDLDLVGATLTNFTFTHCRVRSAVFYGATFVGTTSFRGTSYVSKADFKNTVFDGLVDFRSVDFGAAGGSFAGARFENEVDFGEKTEARLTGAATRTDHGLRRKWPRGWTERARAGDDVWSDLVSGPSPERPSADSVAVDA